MKIENGNIENVNIFAGTNISHNLSVYFIRGKPIMPLISHG